MPKNFRKYNIINNKQLSKISHNWFDAKVVIMIDIVVLLVVNIMVYAIATVMAIAMSKVADVVMDMIVVNQVFIFTE